MFYQYLINLTDKSTNLFTSKKPNHHNNKYYQELKQLIEQDVITVFKPSEKHIDLDNGGFIFQPATYRIIDMGKLQQLASNETVKPVLHRQKGKLLSIVNKYNSQPWVSPWMLMSFNKGRNNCGMCSHTTENHKPNKTDRDAFNNDFFGLGNWVHYDVPSSIPQIIYLMNNKKWYGKRVWDELEPEIKSLGQRLMFCTTQYKLAKSLFQYYKAKWTGKKVNKESSPSKREYWCERQAGHIVESENTEYDVAMEIAKMQLSKLEAIVGKMPGKTQEERNKVFIHESNIYLMVVDKMLDAGAKVYEVYDSFYWNKDSGVTKGQVAEWVKECAEYYINHMDELEAKEDVAFNESIFEYRQNRKADRHLNKKDRHLNKKDRHLNKKVDKWLKINPDSTKYPKKWSNEDIDYANKRRNTWVK